MPAPRDANGSDGAEPDAEVDKRQRDGSRGDGEQSLRWRWRIAVRDDADLTRRAKAVAAALANRMDVDGHCWPSRKLIAKDAGYSADRVRIGLEELVFVGYLKRTRGGGPGNPARYWGLLPAKKTKRSKQAEWANRLKQAEKGACFKRSHVEEDREEEQDPLAEPAGSALRQARLMKPDWGAALLEPTVTLDEAYEIMGHYGEEWHDVTDKTITVDDVINYEADLHGVSPKLIRAARQVYPNGT